MPENTNNNDTFIGWADEPTEKKTVDYKADSEMDRKGTQRDVVPLFLIIDTSGSMGDYGKIEQVNSALEEIRVELAKINETNNDAEIKVSVLCFNTDTKWVTKVEAPENIEANLYAEGLTQMGAAFIELEKMLSRSQLIQRGQCSGYKRAVMILLSDGGPTDDIEPAIKKLKGNHWFERGSRLAIAIGDDIDDAGIGCLEKFTGSKELVIKISNSYLNKLSSVIAVLTKVESETATHTLNIDTNNNIGEGGFETSAEETMKSLIDFSKEQHAKGETEFDFVFDRREK